MCAIIYLKPGQLLPFDKLQNACYNNWHSYGLVVKIDGQLDITKKVPESGEISAEEIQKLLVDNQDYERYLHVRHNTAGTTTVENAHPFDVYYHKKGNHTRQIVFMHNGTLHAYKSKKHDEKAQLVDDDSGPSDTKNYVDKVLIPAVSGMNFGDGPGNIHHPLFKKFIGTDWYDSNNRGILIASDQHHLTLGNSWSSKAFEQGAETILISNDDYFAAVKRGPEFNRRLVREQEEKQRAERERVAKLSSSVVQKGKAKAAASATPITELKNFQFDKKPFFELTTKVEEIINDWDFYDRNFMIAVGYLSSDEIDTLYKDESSCKAVMAQVFTDYASLYEEFVEQEEKKDAGTKMIASLKKEIERLEKLLDKNNIQILEKVG